MFTLVAPTDPIHLNIVMSRSPQITRRHIVERFEAYCSNPKGRAAVVKYIMDIYDRYKDEKLADRHFDRQLIDPDDDVFQQRLSELLMASWLWKDGFTLSSKSVGPDFRAVKNDMTIWIELITPKPTGEELIDYARPLKRGEIDVRTVPSKEIQLRWLSGILDKRKQMERHVNANIIQPNDCYVIAINKRLLDRFNFDVNGISQRPIPVEVGFGVGPMAVQIDTTTGQALSSGHQHVEAIRKPNGSDVPADLFLDPDYRRVSAVLGIALHDRAMSGHRLQPLCHRSLTDTSHRGPRALG